MIFGERTVTKVETRCLASLSAVSLPEQAKLKTLLARSLRECVFTHIVRGVLARKRYLWGNAAAEAGIFGSKFLRILFNRIAVGTFCATDTPHYMRGYSHFIPSGYCLIPILSGCQTKHTRLR